MSRVPACARRSSPSSPTAASASSAIRSQPTSTSTPTAHRARTGSYGAFRSALGATMAISLNNVSPIHHGLARWHVSIWVRVRVIIWNWWWSRWSCSIIHIIWTVCVVWIAAKRIVFKYGISSPRPAWGPLSGKRFTGLRASYNGTISVL